MEYFAGVDTHKQNHAVAIIDELGRVVDKFSIAATKEGYADAVERAKSYAPIVWGLEGTGSYGRGFADMLLDLGALVYEVPGAISKRHRRRLRRRGKSDPQDAHAIAESVLRERPTLRQHVEVDSEEATRLLYERRDRKVKERSAKINIIRALALRLEIQAPKDLTTVRAQETLERSLDSYEVRGYADHEAVDEARDLLLDIRRLHAQILELEKRLRPFAERAPQLMGLRGCSVVTAAGIIGHTGAIASFRNADAYAAYAGTAPIMCSSGKHQSVRLSTGGNRQINRCMHNIANVQIRTPGHAGKIYYDRKRAEGKTHREAMRCLKRQLSSVVFRLMRAAAAPESQPGLAIAA